MLIYLILRVFLPGLFLIFWPAVVRECTEKTLKNQFYFVLFHEIITIIFFWWNWKFNNIKIIYFPDNRASLLRPGTAPKKPLNEKDISMHLWKNYIIFACRVVPPNPSPVIRCVSPDLMLSSSPESLSMITDRSADNKSPSPLIQPSVSNYFFREINSIAAIIIFNMPSLWQTSNFKNGIFVNINLS